MRFSEPAEYVAVIIEWFATIADLKIELADDKDREKIIKETLAQCSIEIVHVGTHGTMSDKMIEAVTKMGSLL